MNSTPTKEEKKYRFPLPDQVEDRFRGNDREGAGMTERKRE